jgi:hypothetical protein
MLMTDVHKICPLVINIQENPKTFLGSVPLDQS